MKPPALNKSGSIRYSALLIFFISMAITSLAWGQVKVVVIPLGGDDAPPPIMYAIGDTGPGGGIVFDVTNGGLNGLEAPPVDQSYTYAPWGCSGSDVAGVDNIQSFVITDSHSGATNTPLIAAACPGATASAAVLAYGFIWPNGQTDSFLPNREQLSLLYDQKDLPGLSYLAGRSYFSSSENNLGGAWAVNFSNGSLYTTYKTGFNPSQYVLSVRAF